jgi:hypothetical protein
MRTAIMKRQFVFIMIDKIQLISLVQPFYKSGKATFACVDLPEDTVLTDVHYSMEEDVFLVKAYHPTFKPVLIGEMAPRIQTSLQYLTLKND